MTFWIENYTTTIASNTTTTKRNNKQFPSIHQSIINSFGQFIHLSLTTVKVSGKSSISRQLKKLCFGFVRLTPSTDTETK